MQTNEVSVPDAANRLEFGLKLLKVVLVLSVKPLDCDRPRIL